MNLYKKIYEAVNTGIQKALIISDDQSKDTSVIFHNKEISAEYMPYEYKTVDLRLPSRLLWCEYNLGAFPGNNPKSWYGDYYAYGETKTKKIYNLNNWTGLECDENDKIEPSDDTAFEILGDPFRMPTKDDFQELLNNTAYKFVKNYKNIHGLNGVLFKSKENNNTLFFPATGYYDENDLDYTCISGNIWSYTIDYDYPGYVIGFGFDFGTNKIDIYPISGYFGFSVRGVRN